MLPTIKNIPNSTSTLLSSAEIVAMAQSEGYPRTNTIAELNTAPSDYYTQLNGDGYIAPSGTRIGNYVLYGTNWPWLRSSANGSVFYEDVDISLPLQPVEYVPYYIKYSDNVWSAVVGSYWWWSND